MTEIQNTKQIVFDLIWDLDIVIWNLFGPILRSGGACYLLFPVYTASEIWIWIGFLFFRWLFFFWWYPCICSQGKNCWPSFIQMTCTPTFWRLRRISITRPWLPVRIKLSAKSILKPSKIYRHRKTQRSSSFPEISRPLWEGLSALSVSSKLRSPPRWNKCNRDFTPMEWDKKIPLGRLGRHSHRGRWVDIFSHKDTECWMDSNINFFLIFFFKDSKLGHRQTKTTALPE